MCNPRKVMIHLTRTIEQAWQRTVEETARLEDQVQEMARLTVDIRLDDEMGDLPLDMLERILQGEFEGFEAWEHDDAGCYRRDLGDVMLVYHRDTHQLTVETALTELIDAEARAAVEVEGHTTGEVAVEAIGRYYDDNWGGRTRERAEREARTEAEQRLETAIEELHRAQNPEAFDAAAADAQQRAAEAAEAELSRRREEVRAAMREHMQAILADAEDRVYLLMNRIVGEAYKQALLQMVRENGGRVLRNEQSGSVIDLELELY